jgi:hypothetical protein
VKMVNALDDENEVYVDFRPRDSMNVELGQHQAM